MGRGGGHSWCGSLPSAATSGGLTWGHPVPRHYKLNPSEREFQHRKRIRKA